MIKRFLLANILLLTAVTAYQWPMYDEYGQPDNKVVTSGFGAYRPFYTLRVDPHIHAGIDIPEQYNAEILELYIWPVDYAHVTAIGGTHPFEYIKIRHYEFESGEFGAGKSEGSTYRHAVPVCAVGEWLHLGDPVTEGWDMYRIGNRHLHLEIRIPGSLVDYQNPFLIDELLVDDTYPPVLESLFVDNMWQGNGEVFCWEYLNSNFMQYYDSVEIGNVKFYRLYLPYPTPYNDWDDPHILVTGNKEVRFVIRMVDAGNSAPFDYCLDIDTTIADLTGGAYDSRSYYHVKFDAFTNQDYYLEEAIFHTENPCVSDWNQQYYRLYPFGELPTCIYQRELLATENLEEGQHRLRVIAQDKAQNIKTADIHIYLKNSNSQWVDFCRPFETLAN